MLMILQGIEKEARIIEKSTGVPTIAAKDGMRLIFGEEIGLGKPRREADLSHFFEPS
jgi:hypothetical protein